MTRRALSVVPSQEELTYSRPRRRSRRSLGTSAPRLRLMPSVAAAAEGGRRRRLMPSERPPRSHRSKPLDRPRREGGRCMTLSHNSGSAPSRCANLGYVERQLEEATV